MNLFVILRIIDYLNLRNSILCICFLWIDLIAILPESASQPYVLADSLIDSQNFKELSQSSLTLKEALVIWLEMAKEYRLNFQLIEALHVYDSILTLIPNEEG